jgi:hypothetical protein
MMAFFSIDEINVYGKEKIIETRLQEAVQILHKIEQKHKGQRVIISGSFLFNKKFNDIDVFVFSKYAKEEYRKGKLHVTFLPESAQESLFFSSLCKICVTNFKVDAKRLFNIGLNDILQLYELLVNSIINKEYYDKNLRDFILQTEYLSKDVILDSQQLYNIKDKLLQQDISILSTMFVHDLLLSFNGLLLKKNLKKQIIGYTKLMTEYKSAKNIPIYIDTYSKVIALAP